MDEKTISLASEMLDLGDAESLRTLLKPHIDQGDIYALFLDSRVSHDGESHEESEERATKMTILAAKEGIPVAMYQMFSLHASGDDFIEQDDAKAMEYLIKAVSSGYSIAKFSYGMILFHGHLWQERDIPKAIDLIKQAVNEGVEGAKEALDKILAADGTQE